MAEGQGFTGIFTCLAALAEFGLCSVTAPAPDREWTLEEPWAWSILGTVPNDAGLRLFNV